MNQGIPVRVEKIVLGRVLFANSAWGKHAGQKIWEGRDCGFSPSSFKLGEVNRNVGGLHRLSDPAWKHAGQVLRWPSGWPVYMADPRRRDNAIYPAPGRRGANERNRRGFASHTVT